MSEFVYLYRSISPTNEQLFKRNKEREVRTPKRTYLPILTSHLVIHIKAMGSYYSSC